MLLISLRIIIILRFRDLNIEQQNKQIMINILQGRTLLPSIFKVHQKSTNKMFFITYDKGLWHIFPLFELKTFLKCILITIITAGSRT